MVWQATPHRKQEIDSISRTSSVAIDASQLLSQVPVSGLLRDLAGTALTAKHAFVSAAASGTAAVVAAVAGQKIRPITMHMHANSAQVLSFVEASSGVALSPIYDLSRGASVNLAYSPHGHFETSAGEGLSVLITEAVTTGVIVTYVEPD